MSFRKNILYFIFFFIPLFVSGQGADFTASETEGCTPFEVEFSLDYTTISLDTATVKWYFGTGDTIVADDTTFIYELSGDYSVTLIVEGDNGRSITEKTDLINVDQTQPADFTILSIVEGETYECTPIEVIDKTVDYTYTWRFTNVVSGKSTSNSASVTGGDISDAVAYVNLQDDLDAVAEDTLFTFNLIIEPTSNLCISDSSKTLAIPYSNQSQVSDSGSADFTISDSSGCTSHAVKFSLDFNTIDLDTVNDVKWYFGMGDTIVSEDPDTVFYEDGGQYTVTLVIEGENKRQVVEKTNIIEVYQTQPASFSLNSVVAGEVYQCEPLDQIIDTTNDYLYDWHFVNVANGTVDDRSITVSGGNNDDAIVSVNLQSDLNAEDTNSIFSFSLTVTNASFGCESQETQQLTLESKIQVANVFPVQSMDYFTITPSENQTLYPKEEYDVILSFEVFSRYGNLVYKEEAPVISWDGRNIDGQEVTTGVYFYILKATTPDETGRYSKQGFIHLFR